MIRIEFNQLNKFSLNPGYKMGSFKNRTIKQKDFKEVDIGR